MVRPEENQNQFIHDLQDAKEFAENIIATIREPLLVLDSNLRVISANNAFYKTFDISREETVGQFFYNLGNNQWDIPRLRELLDKILPNNSVFNDFEVEHTFEKLGKRYMHLNARKIKNNQIILLAIEDVTDRVNFENDLQLKNTELHKALSEIKELRGILPICSYCKKIRNDKGYWEQIEVYIGHHTDADFSHGICPDCMKKYYPDFAKKKQNKTTTT